MKLVIFDVGFGELLSWMDDDGADEVHVFVAVVPWILHVNQYSAFHATGV